MNAANSITLLRAKQPLVKTWTPDGDQPHSLAKQHQFKSVTPQSWDDVLGVVRWMESDRYACMIVGEPAPHALEGWHRRLKNDRGEDLATCLDRPIQIIPFDVDGLELDTTACNSQDEVAALVVAKLMDDIGCPSEPTFVYQWSASAGIKPGIRLKVLLWNEVPVPLERLRELAKGVPYLDASIYDPQQPIYFGAPIFVGVPDPFNGQPRSNLVPGDAQSYIAPGASLLDTPAHLAQYVVDGTGSLSAGVPTLAKVDTALESLRAAGMVLGEDGPGRTKIRCPWAHEHSDARVEAMYLHAHHNGYEVPAFRCLHSHCADRRHEHVVGWLRDTGLMPTPVSAHSSPRGPRHADYPDPKTKKEDDGFVVIGIKSTHANVAAYVKHCGLSLRFNTLTNEPELDGWVQPMAGTDVVLPWLQDAMLREGMPNGATVVTQSMQMLARADSFHPFDDWWNELPQWDGQDRVTQLANTVVTENPDWFSRALRIWLTQVAAATAHPGEIAPELVLTFVGRQGIGKTKWITSLLPGAFTRGSVYLDPTNKDSVMAATAPIVAELGELDAMLPGKSAHAKNEVFKGFMSTKVDVYRPPYWRTAIERARRTVFAGSTNERQFLSDPTGSRRFLPVAATGLDWQHRLDLRQLWSQVRHEHAHGAQWWVDGDTQRWLERYAETFRDHPPEYLETHQLLDETDKPPLRVVGATAPTSGYVAVSASIIARVLGYDPGRTSSKVTRNIGHALRDWTGSDGFDRIAGVRRAFIVPWSPRMNVHPDVLRQRQA